MNKLRLYINLLIVIQMVFLNRRLEVMRLVLPFVLPDVLRLTGVSMTENWFSNVLHTRILKGIGVIVTFYVIPVKFVNIIFLKSKRKQFDFKIRF